MKLLSQRVRFRPAAGICCIAMLLSLMLAGCTSPVQPSLPGIVATMPDTAPTASSVPPTSEIPPLPTEDTAAPTETTTAPTESTAPTDPWDEMIGSLYTRSQLEAMESESKGYGPGTTSGGKRPPYAQSDQKRYEKYGANFIAPESNIIYLTFDCGYEYSFKDANGETVRVTQWILDTLKQKNVKAVFFVTMSYCKSQPDLVQRMIDEGHVVGNHTNHHPNSLANLTIDEMVEEIMSLHEYVREHFGYEMTLLRPPTGAFSTQSLAVAQSLGYKTVHWSFAYTDWDPSKQPDVQSAYDTITGRHHGGAIYLLHAVSVTNATVLADVIDFFRAQDYQLELFQ